MLKIEVIKFEAQDVITSSVAALDKDCQCIAECFKWTWPNVGDPVVGPFEEHHSGGTRDCYCTADVHFYPN